MMTVTRQDNLPLEIFYSFQVLS